jgi:hypothetical protein
LSVKGPRKQNYKAPGSILTAAPMSTMTSEIEAITAERKKNETESDIRSGISLTIKFKVTR